MPSFWSNKQLLLIGHHAVGPCQVLNIRTRPQKNGGFLSLKVRKYKDPLTWGKTALDEALSGKRNFVFAVLFWEILNIQAVPRYKTLNSQGNSSSLYTFKGHFLHNWSQQLWKSNFHLNHSCWSEQVNAVSLTVNKPSLCFGQEWKIWASMYFLFYKLTFCVAAQVFQLELLSLWFFLKILVFDRLTESSHSKLVIC